MLPLDVAGQRFGRLVGVARMGTDAHGKVQWLFRCDCGGETITTASLVKRGTTQSCGCLKRETSAAQAIKNMPQMHASLVKHGDAGRAPEYAVWKTMRSRCNTPTCADYPDYGGRGVKVCERWNDYANFIADMGRRPSHRHSIDRIDVNGNYEPSNCRWASDAEQANNRRPRGSGARARRKAAPNETATVTELNQFTA